MAWGKKQGAFRFKELPVGKYTLKVRMDGFTEQTVTNVEIKKDVKL